MGTVADDFSSAYRNFSTDGDASSGVHNPLKSDLRALGATIETAIAAVASGVLKYDTYALLTADNGQDDGTIALVTSDTTTSNNGLYQYDASTGGGWSKTTYQLATPDETGFVDRVWRWDRKTRFWRDASQSIIAASGLLTSNSNYYGGQISVQEGETYLLEGFAGGASQPLVSILESDDTLISIHGDSAEHHKLELTIPTDGAKLNFSVKKSDDKGMAQVFIKRTGPDYWEQIPLNFEEYEDYYLNGSGNTVSANGWSTMYLSASEGDIFRETGSISGASAKNYCFLDKDDNVLESFAGSGSATVVTLTDYEFTAPADTFALALCFRNDQNEEQKLERYVMLPKVSDTVHERELGELSVLTTKHLFVGVFGQSNAVGNETAITDRQEYGSKSFTTNSATIVNLVSGTSGSTEFPGFGIAAYGQEWITDQGGRANTDGNAPITVGHAGAGGTALEDLVRGNGAFDWAIAQVRAWKAAAGTSTAKHLGTGFFQGEADMSAATDKTEYKTMFAQFAYDYDTFCRQEAPGDHPRITAAIQVTSRIDATEVTYPGGWDIAVAQAEVAEESDLVTIAAPGYIAAYADSVHVTPAWSRMMGAYIWRALVTPGFTPLRVIESYAEGTTIVLVYNRMDLELDTTDVPSQTNSGFTLDDGATSPSAKTISSVTVDSTNTNRVIIECGEDPTGFNWYYGKITAAGITNYSGGAGNLRCSRVVDAFDGTDMYDWAICEEGSVSA